MNKKDFRKDMAEKMIKLMEAGTAPWQKPWHPSDVSSTTLPNNPVTGKPYRGGNVFLLLSKGYQDSRWCTYKQAQSKGWQVRKGEKATVIEYWKFQETPSDINPVADEQKSGEKLNEKPRVFYANVFNVAQMEGVPPASIEKKAPWDIIETAELIIRNSGAKIYHDQQNNAFYRPGTDTIHLPSKGSFQSAMDYYEVLLHELGHWTGHESRLNRAFGENQNQEETAREELRAQMCSLYLAMALQVPFNPDRHAAYHASWIEALKQDKHELFRAAKESENMTDYLLGFQQEKKQCVEHDKKETHLLEKAAEILIKERVQNTDMVESILGGIKQTLLNQEKPEKNTVFLYEKKAATEINTIEKIEKAQEKNQVERVV